MSIIPILTRLNTLMGGGNDREALLAYADAVRELWPDMTTQDFEAALRHGLVHIRWFGKLTIPAIAEFVRDYTTPTKMTRDAAFAAVEALRKQHGIKPGGPLEGHLIPDHIREALR